MRVSFGRMTAPRDGRGFSVAEIRDETGRVVGYIVKSWVFAGGRHYGPEYHCDEMANRYFGRAFAADYLRTIKGDIRTWARPRRFGPPPRPDNSAVMRKYLGAGR